ncbi:MAG: hypothetical protein IJW59_01230 [Clostridia bacterium]|nr:hypothetical protein [Clostridia bacterium]
MRKTKKILNNLINNYIIENNIDNTFDKTIIKYAAPSLILYTKWILEDAKKRNYDRLYFLMRDGKILMEIAKIISPALDCNNIEKTLVYCSRNSLRQACYHINEEHLDLLFLFLPNRTLNDVLLRLFSEKELQEFKELSNLSDEDFSKQLTRSELSTLQNQIVNNPECMECINKKSKEVFECCIGYLEDCGFFEKDKKYALVDTGWNGTMLRSLQEIVKTKTDTKLNEYFYGMFSIPKDIDKENCHTFAFSPQKNKSNKINFNNNLFECFCGDYSGTTLSFVKEKGKCVPLLATPNTTNKETYLRQQEIIIGFTEYLVKNINISLLNNSYAPKLLKKISCHPSYDEAMALNIYKFNEDTTEYNLTTLSIKATSKQFLTMGFIGKIFIKLKLMKRHYCPTYWFFGTLKISDVKFKWFHRLNYNLLNHLVTHSFLRFLYTKRKVKK